MVVGAALGLAEPLSAQQAVTPEAFLDLVEERTMSVADMASGRPLGAERFLGRDRVVWRDADGACVDGRVFVSDVHLCFEYDGHPYGPPPHCWLPVRDAERLFFLAENPFLGGSQEITAIADGSFPCDAPPTS